MKSINPKSFIFGLISGLFILGLFSFTVKSNVFSFGPPEVIKVKNSDAQTYIQNFQKAFPDEIHALNISVQQWSAINKIVEDNNYNLEKISGFRMYYGLESMERDAKKVSLIYSLNNSFEENKPSSSAMVNMAKNYDDKYSQQCPPYCD
ncbi:MAG TPA: hypothetical protein ENK91_00560 [Bacteroidetes bacterium]|nr:hypothetical protein [Bacteroidota bacterium]